MSMTARALVPSPVKDRYQPIPERNLFALKAPQQVTNEPTPPQLPKLLLTGITTILGDRRALMKVQPQAMKPGDLAKEQSLILSEGQREGAIEVLAIDENAGSVKVNNSGTVVTLTFEKDGAKLPSTPPPPGVPPGLPATNGPQTTGFRPGFPPPASMNANPAVRGLIPRNGVAPAPAVTPPANTGAVSPPGATADTALPPTGGSTPAIPAQALPADLTPEEQTIVLELQRQANQQNSSFPPLPPTVLTPGGGNATAPIPGANPLAPPRTIAPQ